MLLFSLGIRAQSGNAYKKLISSPATKRHSHMKVTRKSHDLSCPGLCHLIFCMKHKLIPFAAAVSSYCQLSCLSLESSFSWAFLLSPFTLSATANAAVRNPPHAESQCHSKTSRRNLNAAAILRPKITKPNETVLLLSRMQPNGKKM